MKFRTSRKNRTSPQDQMRDLIRRTRELVGGLDAETFNRNPPGGGWSAGQCLDHLNVSARLYLPVFTDAITEARVKGLTGGRDAGRTLLGRLVTWSMEPPPRFRSKTFQDIEPSDQTLDPVETLEQFEALHEELIVRMNEASDLDWKKVKMRSVLDSRLKLSLGDWFVFMCAHGRRHIWQAENVLRGEG